MISNRYRGENRHRIYLLLSFRGEVRWEKAKIWPYVANVSKNGRMKSGTKSCGGMFYGQTLLLFEPGKRYSWMTLWKHDDFLHSKGIFIFCDPLPLQYWHSIPSQFMFITNSFSTHFPDFHVLVLLFAGRLEVFLPFTMCWFIDGYEYCILT